jgi:hypothetical protein
MKFFIIKAVFFDTKTNVKISAFILSLSFGLTTSMAKPSFYSIITRNFTAKRLLNPLQAIKNSVNCA